MAAFPMLCDRAVLLEDYFHWFHDMLCGVEKSQREEDRMMYEHQREVQELRKELREKDSLLDDLTQNNEVQLQVWQCDESILISPYVLVTNMYTTIRYDTGCYFNVQSKSDMSRLNLQHVINNCVYTVFS